MILFATPFLGLDHNRLTYFHGGLENKLTGGVEANMMQGILA